MKIHLFEAIKTGNSCWLVDNIEPMPVIVYVFSTICRPMCLAHPLLIIFMCETEFRMARHVCGTPLGLNTLIKAGTSIT